MKKSVLTILTLLGLMFNLSAEKATYRLNVEKFCELVVVDGINVDYVCNPDSAGWAVFTTTPEIASKITFSNNAEKLSIQTTAEEAPLSDIPVITVYSGVLRKVENSGDSLVRVIAKCPTENLKAIQIGNGRLEIHGIEARNVDASVAAGNGTLSISGHADKAKIKNVGTGHIDAAEFDADEITCLVFGTGNISCNSAEKLKVYGAGTGKVLYTENPSKIVNRSIGVKVTSVADTIPSERKDEVLTATRK